VLCTPACEAPCAGTYPPFCCVLPLLLLLLPMCPPAALYSANPGLAKLLFALVFPVGLTMNTLHGTGEARGRGGSFGAATTCIDVGGMGSGGR
jgi:hypothetical protein